jgi:murein DD-endopeptidase MepM/ murein hydrolase activator NlpD
MLRPALILAALLPLTSARADSATLGATPTSVRPGDAVMITLRGAKNRCPSGQAGERSFKFFEAGGLCRAVVGVPVEQSPGPLTVKVGSLTTEVQVEPAAFRERTLTVAAKYTDPPEAVQERMAADRRAFQKAFDQKFSSPLFKGNFALPMTSEMTAPFGDLRLFNGKKQGQHYGMDLDGRIGDPVYAANDGKVVMARNNYAAGRTVVLHHGGDLYTTYLHLSAIGVKQGQKVSRGELLGKVGKTGRVTGPHLHWGVKASGLYVDPASLLRLDFEAGDPAPILQAEDR